MRRWHGGSIKIVETEKLTSKNSSKPNKIQVTRNSKSIINEYLQLFMKNVVLG